MKLLFSFKGRIGRAQYWLGSLGMGVIWTILIGLVVAMLSPMLKGMQATPGQPGQPEEMPPAFIAAIVFLYIPLFWVSLALTIKRGHDRGRSAWWQLLALVPIVNIWLFVDQGFLRGVDETNQWGPPAVPREPALVT